MTAEDQDLYDYRSYRVAAHPGRRLMLADDYLHEHPRGAWFDEVHASFDTEETAYFERAKTSRAAAHEYLTYLPRGPHADQSVALIAAFDTNLEEIALQNVARDVRRNEATLESAAVARRRVGESVLTAVGALSDDNVYHARIDDAPVALRKLLDPPQPRSWGGLAHARETDLYFMLPTRPERESRVVTLRIRVETDATGMIDRGIIEGDDLFVRWQEADRIVALDPTSLSDRTEAGVHALDILSGALEGRFPADRCALADAHGALYARACEGLSVDVVMGDSAGSADRIVLTASKKR